MPNITTNHAITCTESALYEIFTLVSEISEKSLVLCAHSFDFRHYTNCNSCENPVRARCP